jgi:hypothetical protein
MCQTEACPSVPFIQNGLVDMLGHDLGDDLAAKSSLLASMQPAGIESPRHISKCKYKNCRA